MHPEIKELLIQGQTLEALDLHRHTEQAYVFDPVERAKERAADYNATPGSLHLHDGVECADCRNKGWVSVARVAEDMLAPCSCMTQRRAVAQLRNSGLQDLIGRYTMDAFTERMPWHQDMRKKADAFLASDSAWYFAGGQVGCGKTHICTAICAELLQRGVSVRYMLWRDESMRLKAIVNGPDYHEAVAAWKTAPALYIDDLFKAARADARDMPTGADIRLAFEIINHRYNDRKLRTIISSEWMLEEIMRMDDGVASRIFERSKGCCVEIGRDAARNHRIAG